MKTGEQHLKTTSIGRSILRVLRENFTEEGLIMFFEELEQFRKEGMKEAFYGGGRIDTGRKNEKGYTIVRDMTFEEWYNNQI